MTSKFILRFDDITPGMAWSKFSAIELQAKSLGIPLLLGVVPDCQDPKLIIEPERPDFWDKVREWRELGWTIAQHGYRHIYGTHNSGLLGINNNSEFAGLSYAEQFSKLQKGKQILLREGVWQPIFMAPSHSFDANTLKALSALDFTHITDGYGIFPYKLHEIKAVPQLFSKSQHIGFGIYTICFHINNIDEIDSVNISNMIDRIFANIISFDDVEIYMPTSSLLIKMSNLIVFILMTLVRNIKRNLKVCYLN